MDRWLTDTATTARFPLFTRANADEIGPAPFPPLTWTLAWERGAVPGTVDAWVHLGAFRREEFREPIAEVYGCWGGYLYNQVSVGRVFGARAPGASPDDIDRTYFGSNPEVPRYVPHPLDDDEACAEAVGRTLTSALTADRLPHVEALIADVKAWARERPTLEDLRDEELIELARAACGRLRRAWDVYIQVVISASVAPGVVHAIASAAGRADKAVAVFTSVGDVESARTNQQLWELSRFVRESAGLTAAFDAGTADVLERLSKQPEEADAREFLARFDAFLAEYGHRGPNEYDLASDTWATRPTTVLDMIDRVRLQDDEESPVRRASAGAVRREEAMTELEQLVAEDTETLTTLRTAVRSGQLFYRMREAGKDALVRAVHEVRLPVVELGRRLCRSGDLADVSHLFQLRDSELDSFVANPVDWRNVLADRAERFSVLANLVPPYVVMDGTPVPPISSWPERASASAGPAAAPGVILTGVGASPGVVTGPARVVDDLSEVDELHPGDILLCAYTDPSWTPLLMAAGGVVCQVGAEGSHAAIVSRELGVPCVVSVRDAKQTIRTGQLIRVDGGVGTVTVLDSATP